MAYGSYPGDEHDAGQDGEEPGEGAQSEGLVEEQNAEQEPEYGHEQRHGGRACRTHVLYEAEVDHVGHYRRQQRQPEHAEGNGQRRRLLGNADYGQRQEDRRRRRQLPDGHPDRRYAGEGVLGVGGSQRVGEGGNEHRRHSQQNPPVQGQGVPTHENRDPEDPQDYPEELLCRQGITHPHRGNYRREHHGGGVQDGSEGGRQVYLGGGDERKGYGRVEKPEDQERSPPAPDLRNAPHSERVEYQDDHGEADAQLDEQERPQVRHGDADEQKRAAPQRAEQREASEIPRSHTAPTSGRSILPGRATGPCHQLAGAIRANMVRGRRARGAE